MRIGHLPLQTLMPRVGAHEPASSSQPQPPPRSQPPSSSSADGLIDHVSALVDRLAVQAGASGQGDADAAGTDPQVLSLMRDVFGVGPISDLHLDFDYQHRADSGASASYVQGDGFSAAHASAYALDATSFSAKGTFTDADGHHYAFTLRYAAVAAAAVDMDHASVSGAASPTDHGAHDAGAPHLVSAQGAAPHPAWSLSALLQTVTKPDATAPTLIDRLRQLLGLDAAPGASAAA